MSELQRASVFAIVEETTVGTLKAPSSGSDFVPLRAGFSQTSSLEELASDELVNDIGATKSLTGLEIAEGSHPAYLKHSEVEGQEPEIGLLYESAFGAKTVNATEYDVVSGSTAGTSSAAATLVVDTGEGVNFEIGQAVLIKDATNGYSIRNVYGISTDTLTLNFNLSAAPASGTNLGKAILYKPAASGHPSFSAWAYGGNGGYIQAVAGCKTSEINYTLTAGQQAEVEFSYVGVETFKNPVVITATTKYIDFVDTGGTKVAILTEGSYKSPIAFAEHVASVMDAASVDTITCVYNSLTGKYLTTGGATFSLLWNSGTNTANSAATKLGDTTAADRTGATNYTSTNAINLAAPYTPAYDNAQNIVVKNAEFMVGSFSDNICRAASEVRINIGIEQEDVTSICAVTGKLETLPTAREVTIEADLILRRYETHLFDKFINNKDVAAMVNAGQNTSAGNWIAGTCFNFYLPQATLTQHENSGDTVVLVTVTAKGYISGTKKDCYQNFV